jgi:hypothetical protein
MEHSNDYSEIVSKNEWISSKKANQVNMLDVYSAYSLTTSHTQLMSRQDFEVQIMRFLQYGDIRQRVIEFTINILDEFHQTTVLLHNNVMVDVW